VLFAGINHTHYIFHGAILTSSALDGSLRALFPGLDRGTGRQVHLLTYDGDVARFFAHGRTRANHGALGDDGPAYLRATLHHCARHEHAVDHAGAFLNVHARKEHAVIHIAVYFAALGNQAVFDSGAGRDEMRSHAGVAAVDAPFFVIQVDG